LQNFLGTKQGQESLNQLKYCRYFGSWMMVHGFNHPRARAGELPLLPRRNEADKAAAAD